MEYDLNIICRSCLTTSNFLDSVYENCENSKSTWDEMIMSCTNVMITKDDGLPNKICNVCAHEVMNAYLYKQKCEDSDTRLREYVLSKQQEIIIKEEVIEVKCEIDEYDPLTAAAANAAMGITTELVIIYEENDDEQHKQRKGQNKQSQNNKNIVESKIKTKKLKSKRPKECVNYAENSEDEECNIKRKKSTVQNDPDFIVSSEIEQKNIIDRGGGSGDNFINNGNANDDDNCNNKDNLLKYLDENKEIDKDEDDGGNDYDGGGGGDDVDDDYEEEDDVDDDAGVMASSAKKVNGRLICYICDKSLADKRTLKLHIRLHTGKNLKRCHICDRGFAKQNHLTRHLLSHNKKQYQCKICEDTFKTHNDRRTHELKHKGDKAEKGDKGNERKSSRDPETRRIKRKILRTAQTYDSFYFQGQVNNIKTCICKICDKMFKKIWKLKNHLNWHSNDIHSFDEIKLLEKPDLFLDGNFDKADDITESKLVEIIQTKLKTQNLDGLYQMFNSTGRELNLSDSETDDSNDVDVDDGGGGGGQDESRNAVTGVCSGNLENTIIKDNYDCSQCKRTFDRVYKIVAHMKNDHRINDFEKFRCTHCYRFYPNKKILSKHLKSNCENKEKKLTCLTCNLKFRWPDSLSVHELQHVMEDQETAEKKKHRTKTFVCDSCPKSYFRSEHLERHRVIHLPSDRKFECDVCKKKFNRKDNLRSHMRVHNGKEKEEGDKQLCAYCGRSFSNSSNLIVHMRRHTGEKPYKCDFCDKGFPRSSDLSCHRRTHTGEKPCLCTICGKGFSRSNKLVRHMRIHTGVRPYKCTYCERAFTQSNDLTLHIRRHTGDKPYVCGICGDRFIQGTALQTHRRSQGHFETEQPTPFSSVSVNNPNRFTNTFRVNRIGVPPPQTSASPSTIIKKEKQQLPTTINRYETNSMLPPPPPHLQAPHTFQHTVSTSNEMFTISQFLPPSTTSSSTSSSSTSNYN